MAALGDFRAMIGVREGRGIPKHGKIRALKPGGVVATPEQKQRADAELAARGGRTTGGRPATPKDVERMRQARNLPRYTGQPLAGGSQSIMRALRGLRQW